MKSMKKYLALFLAIMFMVTLAPMALATDADDVAAVVGKINALSGADLNLPALTHPDQYTEVSAEAAALAIAIEAADDDSVTVTVETAGDFDAAEAADEPGNITVSFNVEKGDEKDDTNELTFVVPFTVDPGDGGDTCPGGSCTSKCGDDCDFDDGGDIGSEVNFAAIPFLSQGTGSSIGGTINLVAETISITGTYAGYSFNGTKWFEGDLSPDAFKAQLGKGIPKLTFATELTANKKAASGTSITVFPAINKRPKGNPDKLTVFYNQDNTWSFAARRATEALPAGSLSSFQWVPTATTDRAPADGAVFVPFNNASGEKTVKGLAENGKVQRSNYHFRNSATKGGTTAAPVYTPASSVFRVTVSGQLRAPRARANYKTEVVALRANTFYATGTSMANARSATATMTSIKMNLTIGNVLNPDTIGGVIIQTAATGKRPASAKFELELARRFRAPTVSDLAFNADTGKFERETTKDHEMEGNNEKWSGIKVRKTAGTESSLIRRKAGKIKTDKDGNLTDDSGSAASRAVLFTITVGQLPNTEKTKLGIIKVELAGTGGGSTDPVDPGDEPCGTCTPGDWISNATQHWKECAECGEVTTAEADHEWEDGVCEVCEYPCEHSDWTDGVCDVCEYECLHPDWTDGACDVCEHECEHDDNDPCGICEKANP